LNGTPWHSKAICCQSSSKRSLTLAPGNILLGLSAAWQELPQSPGYNPVTCSWRNLFCITEKIVGNGGKSDSRLAFLAALAFLTDCRATPSYTFYTYGKLIVTNMTAMTMTTMMTKVTLIMTMAATPFSRY
jgi:hypothetical protein